MFVAHMYLQAHLFRVSGSCCDIVVKVGFWVGLKSPSRGQPQLNHYCRSWYLHMLLQQASCTNTIAGKWYVALRTGLHYQRPVGYPI